MDLIPAKILNISSGTSGIGTAYFNELFKRKIKACAFTNTDEHFEVSANEINDYYENRENTALTDKQTIKNSFKTNIQRVDGLNLIVSNTGVLKIQTPEPLITDTSHAGLNFFAEDIINTLPFLKIHQFSECSISPKDVIMGHVKTPFCYDLPGWRFLKIGTNSIVPDAEHWEKEFPDLEKGLANQLSSFTWETAAHLVDGFNTILCGRQIENICMGEEIKLIYDLVTPGIVEKLEN